MNAAAFRAVVGLKVEFVEPFVRSAEMVLAEVCGQAAAGPLGLLGREFTANATSIAVCIEGHLAGEVVYSMSCKSAERMLSCIEEAGATSGIARGHNGLGRLGARLADRAVAELRRFGLECRAAEPIVVRGYAVEFSAAVPALTVVVNTACGDVAVNVAVSDDR